MFNLICHSGVMIEFSLEPFTATLPLPPSINRTYAFNAAQKRFYSNPPVKQWKQNAYDLLMAAGWKPLPPGNWTLAIHLVMHIPEPRDVDSGSKVIQDVLCRRLGVDDRYVFDFRAQKVVTPAKRDQHFQVWVTATCLN